MNKPYLIPNNSNFCMVAILNENQIIQKCNKEFENILNYHDSEIVGKHVVDLFFDREFASDLIKCLMHEKKVVCNQIILLSKNGQYRYIDLYIEKIECGHNINEFQILFVGIDVTKIVKQEELTHKIFKEIPYPSKVFFVDTECKIKYANDEFAKFTGFEKGDDIIGKEPEEVLGVEKSIIREVIEKGNTIINERRDPIINHKGDKLYHLVSCLPIKDGTGTLLGALEVLTDIKELREQEELTKQIIKKMPYPVHMVFIDVDKKIRYADEDFLKFVKAESFEDIIGKSIREVVSGIDIKKPIAEMVIDSKEPIFNKKTVLKINRINGAKEDHIHVLASCVPIKNEMGELLGALEVFTDITEQDQLNILDMLRNNAYS